MKVQKSPNLAEIKISYSMKVKVSDRETVRSTPDAYRFLKGLYSSSEVDHHEQFIILLLNRSMHVLGWAKIAIGGIDSTVADVRIIFQYALKANATSIVLSHNHPSGRLEPSENDIIMTRRAVRAGEYLDVQVNDHLIVTSEGYYSMADEGDI